MSKRHDSSAGPRKAVIRAGNPPGSQSTRYGAGRGQDRRNAGVVTSRFEPRKKLLTYNYGNRGHWYQFANIIESVKSPYQQITFAQHSDFGKCLILDNDLMSSERNGEYDEAMISLMPPGAKRILILGGGDGSLAARLGRHVKITMVEQDMMVRKLSKKHFGISMGGNVTEMFCDAHWVVSVLNSPFDVVFCDLPDEIPIGIYRQLRAKLPGASFIAQTGSDTRRLLCGDLLVKRIKSICPDALTISRFIPDFMEHWTFTYFHA